MRMRVKQIQQGIVPKDDLTPYAGRWVLLRQGSVVASGSDPLELRAQADARDSDALQLVPTLGARHLVL